MGEKYIPLYRKYRPKNLQEVVGQEHVKKALTNAIELKKITHAYLFTGPRGTGKTSIARILAKSLNCQQGPTVTPCEVCASCVDIKNSTPMDVIEIDAASNRKVEDAQNILEKIQYVPVNGKYKIYIIDEVHMLTNHAFNALLKTLEEPPENVIFILATTEPQKVLETIISRCQRFDFRRITTEDIVSHLKNIAKLEKIKIDDEALFTIAKNAAGGMRDSLALLDQLSVLDSAKIITTEDINRLLGRLSFDVLNNLSENLIQSQPQKAIELLEKIYNSGNEPSQILINLLAYFKNLLIVKNCEGKELLLDLTQLNETQISALKKQSEDIETHQITFLIEKIVYYINELKTTTNQHLWLEIAIIDLANLAQNTSLLALQERVTRLEGGNFTPQVSAPVQISRPAAPKKVEVEIEKPKVEIPSAPMDKVAESVKKEEPVEQSITEEPEDVEEAPMPLSHPKQTDNLANLWTQLLQSIASTPTVSLLSQHAGPIEISEDKIIIGCKDAFVKMLNGDAKKSSIEDGAKKLFNKSVNVIIQPADSSAFEKKNLTNAKSEETKVKTQPVKCEIGSSPSGFHCAQDIQSSNLPTLQPTEDIDEETDFIEHELAKNKKPDKIIVSDQVSMVMSLFDGKYID